MTPTTSSALSETLSARNRVDGTSAATRRSTSAPPEIVASEPPGRCTSSSTTSGRVSAITATADGTSAASPTTSIERSRSARRPDRKIEWSSTTTTVSVSAMLRPRLESQVHLGAFAARAGSHGGAAACAPHPPDDRLAHAEPTRRDLRRVEPRSAVAHVHVDRVGRTLEVHRHLTARVPGGVEHRLARGRVELAARPLIRHADGDDVDPHRVVELEGGREVAQVGREVAVGRGIALVEPAAQLALLRAREPPRLTRRAG